MKLSELKKAMKGVFVVQTTPFNKGDEDSQVNFNKIQAGLARGRGIGFR